MSWSGRNSAAAATLVALVVCGCDRPGGPDSITAHSGGTGGTTQIMSAIKCALAHSSQPLPARSTVTSPGSTGGSSNTYFTSDLFNQFKSICGGCHVDTNLGNFQVNAGSFSTQVTQTVVNIIMSDDPTVYMPPAAGGGMPFSQRGTDDPVAQMVSLLQLWLAQGSPAGVFMLPASDGTTPSGNYALTPTLGADLTNIGNCIPDPSIVATSTTTMNELDAFFAQATVLPDTLDQTDLTDFDSDTLAQTGVISFAPAYPLWADNAEKMRHVRVPVGQSIKFDKTTQEFQIPPNTRFYKTFLKHVVDAAGNDSYRKIETRLIVSRPDQPQPTGGVKPTALFGTYLWNDDETEAQLMKDPLRNGQPFRDRLMTYITDEPKAQAITDSMPPNLDYALEVENPGLVRHYAVPGSERCTECHMGSPSASFVLGFRPIQLSRLPPGTSGVIEPAAADELTQLQRLISYGVISGMTSPADVLPLQSAEGTRQPRNDQELTAQAYMVGNCAHCHNPRGFPSMKAPALANVLNFLPSPTGGVFQFPLETTSPIRQRGLQQNVPIPYLTPSLRDYPGELYSTPKYYLCSPGDTSGWCAPKQTVEFVDAPWRSLIYRNVDTPFDYVDDLAIFPHMPMNTPGYDCRVPQIMGNWMVSIPAALKNPQAQQDALPGPDGTNSNFDLNAQPYVEVKPTDPGYADALTAAQARLATYQAGKRYGFCPDVVDIVDLAVLNASGPGAPQTPADIDSIVYDPTDPTKLVMADIGVPGLPDWVITDTTDPPGDWSPRRPDWADAIVSHIATNTSLDAADLESLQNVVAALPSASLTADVRAKLLTEVPYGLWEQKPACNFTGVPTAGSFQGDSRPRWMNNVGSLDPNAPVYMASPAAAVFTGICINCHGPQADAQGLLADEISIMTGGDARVANFRSGLFGPLDTPGANRIRVFGPAAAMDPTGQTTADDVAARYMSWMALGGTQRRLPSSILSIIGAMPVLGQQRLGKFLTPTGSANMLKLGQDLCTHVLPANPLISASALGIGNIFSKGTLDWSNQTSLIDTNGDAANWQLLCNLNNRPIVRVPYLTKWDATVNTQTLYLNSQLSFYWGDNGAYPSTAPVLDHRGKVVTGITPDNLFPLCIRKPTDPQELAVADQFLKANPVGGPGGDVIPYCPPELFTPTATTFLLQSQMNEDGTADLTDVKKWAARGAINAGLAVFLYIDQLEREMMPKPLYNQCDLLGGGTAGGTSTMTSSSTATTSSTATALGSASSFSASYLPSP